MRSKSIPIFLWPLILSVAVIGYCIESQEQQLAIQLLKPLDKDFKDVLMINDSYTRNSESRKAMQQQLSAKYEDIILKNEEIGDQCGNLSQKYIYLKSHRLSDVIEIRNTFLCKKDDLRFIVSFFVYQNYEKARIGLNERLNTVPGNFTLEQTTGSYSGKKYGEFCIRTGHERSNIIGLIILQQNIYADIQIVGKKAVSIEILDEWGQNALTKMKKVAH